MTKKKWYAEWFSSEYYPMLYRHRDDEDAEDIINLIQRRIPLPTDSRVLDVGCGAGRHSIELARRGYDVTGFDLSSFLIKTAKKNFKLANEKGLKVSFYIRDMKDFSFKTDFDMAINVFSSFGYFDTDAQNFRVIKNIYASLKVLGFFVFDYLNETYLRDNLVNYTESIIDGKKIIQKRRIENDVVIKDILTGGGKFTERLKLYTYDELSKALKDNGFRIREIFGDYYGNSFGRKTSRRLLIFAQKT